MDVSKLQKKIPFQWRVQAFYPKENPTSCQCVAYIDARDVMALLDEVCGPEGWMSDYKEVKGHVYGGVAIKNDAGEWIWKWDCGTETDIEGEKGQASDAFKRAAVKWGVGRFLYDMGLQRLSAKKEGYKAMPIDAQGRPIYDLTRYINDMNKTPAQRLGMFAAGISMEQHLAQEAAKAAPVAPASQSPAPAPAPTQAQPNPDALTTRGAVKNVFKKTGPKKDGSNYTRFAITMEDGTTLTTFAESFGAIAEKSLEHGLDVTCTYKLNGKWKDIQSFVLSDESAGQALEDSFMQNLEEPPQRNSRWG